MALVERNRSPVGRLKEGGAVIGVDARQALLEQVRAKASSLTSTVDPEPGEIPVRILRMGGIHLFQGREGIRVLLSRNRFGQRSDDRVTVRFDARALGSSRLPG